MNATFHVISSLAIASALSLKPTENIFSISSFGKYAIGFSAGILAHGVMDFLPHEYPLYPKVDVCIGLGLFLMLIPAVKNRNLILLTVCFVGAIFPDLVDLAPEIIKKYLGFDVPHFPHHIFPWHWKSFSGSIYDGSRRVESVIYHILLLTICGGLLYLNRQKFFVFWKD